MKKAALDFAPLLRSRGFKATPGRIELLRVLAQEGAPLTVQEIGALLPRPLSEVTLYRALEALEHADIVSKVELGHGHAHYELRAGKKHHHHLVCTSCDAIEDIDACSIAALQQSVLRDSRRFTSIYSHNLEFFGSCTNCSKIRS